MACNCRNPNRIVAYGCSPTPRVIWAFTVREKRGVQRLVGVQRDANGSPSRTSFQGSYGIRSVARRGGQPRWYRLNDINVVSRTGYINIMLTRFSVKRAPPAETVASARRRPDTNDERSTYKEAASTSFSGIPGCTRLNLVDRRSIPVAKVARKFRRGRLR